MMVCIPFIGLSQSPNVTYDEDRSTSSIIQGVRHTVVGKQALDGNGTNSNDNIAVGKEALKDSDGYENIAIGNEAMKNSIPTNPNGACIAVGKIALRNNIGGFNIAIGHASMGIENEGESNVALGMNALEDNKEGNRNLAVGNWSLQDNKSGSENVGIGYYSLGLNQDGQYNTSIGNQSMLKNISGQENTAVGYYALQSNNSNKNTAMGSAAMQFNTTGDKNTGVGYTSLRKNTTGHSNTGLGSGSVHDNTTGSENVGVGRGALRRNTTGSHNTAVGFHAYHAENKTDGQFNTAVGSKVYEMKPTTLGKVGDYNTAIGYQAGILESANQTFYNTTSLGYGAIATDNNMVTIGNQQVQTIRGAATLTTYSDKRLKTNIKDSELGLDFITRLRPVNYYMTNDENKDKMLRTGLIAQEVAAVLDELGEDFDGLYRPKHEDDYYAVAYGALTVPLVNAVKTQQEYIDELENRVQTLELQLSKFSELEQRMETLSRAISDEPYAQLVTNATIEVQPNPADDYLNIVAKQAIKAYTITDLDGKVIDAAKLGADVYQVSDIELVGLVSGLYMIQVQFEDGHSVTQKFVKQ